MAVDVVVVNYHTNEDLDTFIQSYHYSKFDGCTLTVVDVEVDSSRSYGLRPNCDYFLPIETNVGYGRACNAGAATGGMSGNDVLLLANADTIINTGIHDCYNALMEHDDWGVLGPRQINSQGRITAGGIFGSERQPSQRGWNQPNSSEFADVREDALTVSGSLYFIKRSVWEELSFCSIKVEYQPDSCGAFLETKHYFDETSCSYHARAHGYKCVYYGPVCMIHEWHKASPHGGWADQQFAASQQMHRELGRLHGYVTE